MPSPLFISLPLLYFLCVSPEMWDVFPPSVLSQVFTLWAMCVLFWIIY